MIKLSEFRESKGSGARTSDHLTLASLRKKQQETREKFSGGVETPKLEVTAPSFGNVGATDFNAPVGDVTAELSRLENLRRQAAVDLDTSTVDALDKRMKELRASVGQQTVGDRFSDVLSAFTGGMGAGLSGTAGFVMDAYTDPGYHQRAIESAQKVLENSGLKGAIAEMIGSSCI